MVAETESTNAEITFGILGEKPTLEELAHQIKLGAEMYAELKQEFYDFATSVLDTLKAQNQYNHELFNQFVNFGLKANYTERETKALKEDNQHHYSQVHSNRTYTNKYNKYIL
jgi:hypothetical protein